MTGQWYVAQRLGQQRWTRRCRCHLTRSLKEPLRLLRTATTVTVRLPVLTLLGIRTRRLTCPLVVAVPAYTFFPPMRIEYFSRATSPLALTRIVDFVLAVLGAETANFLAGRST